MSDYESNYKRSYAQDYSQGYGQPTYGQSYGSSYSRYDDDEGETNWTYVITGALFVAAGAYLIYRGVSSDDDSQSEEDYNPYAATGSRRGDSREDGSKDGSKDSSKDRGKGVQVRETIVVNKPVEELYSYWRKLENLPRIMSHLESVTEMGSRSHWKAKGPLGINPEWDAEITEERKNETISWRSLEDSQVHNEGTVRFSGSGGGSVNNPYTIVTVSLTYHPPLGAVGAALAKLFGEEPSQQIKDDLGNFKQAVESGSLSLTR